MIAAALVLSVAGSVELYRSGALAASCMGLGLPARHAFRGWRRSGLAGATMLLAAAVLLLVDRLGGL